MPRLALEFWRPAVTLAERLYSPSIALIHSPITGDTSSRSFRVFVPSTSIVHTPQVETEKQKGQVCAEGHRSRHLQSQNRLAIPPLFNSEVLPEEPVFRMVPDGAEASSKRG